MLHCADLLAKIQLVPKWVWGGGRNISSFQEGINGGPEKAACRERGGCCSGCAGVGCLHVGRTVPAGAAVGLHRDVGPPVLAGVGGPGAGGMCEACVQRGCVRGGSLCSRPNAQRAAPMCRVCTTHSAVSAPTARQAQRTCAVRAVRVQCAQLSAARAMCAQCVGTA